MKAILEYNLPEEAEAFSIATSGGVYLRVLGEFHDYLDICHGMDHQPDLGIIRDTFNALCEEHGVGE